MGCVQLKTSEPFERGCRRRNRPIPSLAGGALDAAAVESSLNEERERCAQRYLSDSAKMTAAFGLPSWYVRARRHPRRSVVRSSS